MIWILWLYNFAIKFIEGKQYSDNSVKVQLHKIPYSQGNKPKWIKQQFDR